MKFFGFLKSEKQSNLKQMQKAWRNFEHFYLSILADDYLSK